MVQQTQSTASLQIASRAFGERECAIYGKLSQDYNPIHSDKEFAAETPFRHPIVFGFLFVMPIWGAIQKTFGEAAVFTSKATIRFIRPLLVGQTANYKAQIEKADGDANIVFTITAAERDDPIAIVQVTLPIDRPGRSQ